MPPMVEKPFVREDGEWAVDARAAKYLNYGIDHLRLPDSGEGEGEGVGVSEGGKGEGKGKDTGRTLFFKALPKASFDVGRARGGVDHLDLRDMFLNANRTSTSTSASDARAQRVMLRVGTEEAEKARQFAQLVDLRNANARGVAFENRRRVVEAFSPEGSPADTGYPEVQGE